MIAAFGLLWSGFDLCWKTSVFRTSFVLNKFRRFMSLLRAPFTLQLFSDFVQIFNFNRSSAVVNFVNVKMCETQMNLPSFKGAAQKVSNPRRLQSNSNAYAGNHSFHEGTIIPA